jgi:hypothetical protein
LREVLCAAGYNAMTTTTINDAEILLKATKAKLAVISSGIKGQRGRSLEETLHEIDPAIALIMLDQNFASQDPGEAAEKLLSDVARVSASANA